MLEIERRFLIGSLPDGIMKAMETCEKADIWQAYINVRPTIRIRRAGAEFFLTVKRPKGGGLLVKDEFEIPLDGDEFMRLRGKIDGDYTPVEKTRYRLPLENGLIIELDVYSGKLSGLMTAEVEFGSEEEAVSFAPPEWFGREVTEDARYANSSLSRYGLPD